jgi:hypothetical protein
MHPGNFVEPIFTLTSPRLNRPNQPTRPRGSPEVSYFLFFVPILIAHVIYPFSPICFIHAAHREIQAEPATARGSRTSTSSDDGADGMRTLGELPREEFRCEAPCRGSRSAKAPWRAPHAVLTELGHTMRAPWVTSPMGSTGSRTLRRHPRAQIRAAARGLLRE